MKTLRLLITKKCNRHCKGCCNKDWDLDNLSIVSHYNYDEVILTGGEPLIFIDKLIDLCKSIRKKTKAKIYVYTALIKYPIEVLSILNAADGLTVTLHDKEDSFFFNSLDFMVNSAKIQNKSLRLNVFKGIKFSASKIWKIKKDIQWIKDCPLPKNEEFKRLKVLF